MLIGLGNDVVAHCNTQNLLHGLVYCMLVSTCLHITSSQESAAQRDPCALGAQT